MAEHQTASVFALSTQLQAQHAQTGMQFACLWPKPAQLNRSQWSPTPHTSVSIKRSGTTYHRQAEVRPYRQHHMRDDIHWLPVRQRILFKLSTLVSKCLRRTAPSYLTDMCIPVSTASGRSDSLVSTVVLAPWLENPALSTVTIRITQLLCVRSHSLKLTSNSGSQWLVIIIPSLFSPLLSSPSSFPPSPSLSSLPFPCLPLI